MSQPDELMIQTLELASGSKEPAGVKYSSDLLRKIGQKIDRYELAMRPALVDEKYEIDLMNFKDSKVVKTDLSYVMEKFVECYRGFLKKEGKPMVNVQINFKRCGINICDEKGEIVQRIGFETRIIEL